MENSLSDVRAAIFNSNQDLYVVRFTFLSIIVMAPIVTCMPNNDPRMPVCAA